jgi:hypothetical protein
MKRKKKKKRKTDLFYIRKICFDCVTHAAAIDYCGGFLKDNK